MKRSLSPSNINLEKDGQRRTSTNSGKPDRFEAGSKPSQTTSEVSRFGVKGTRELGSFGGIKATNDAELDLGTVVGPQRISGSINPTEQSAKAQVDLGIKKGFGINFGGKIKRTPTGVSVENVSFGVNVLGFGVNAEGKGSESSKLGVSAFGVSVEVASDKEGRNSIRLGFSLPGFDTGVTFQPDGEKIEKQERPTPPIDSEPDTSINTPPKPNFPLGKILELFYAAKGVEYDSNGQPYQNVNRLELRARGRVTTAAFSVIDPGNTYYSIYNQNTGYSQNAVKPFPPNFNVNAINRITVISDSWNYYPDGYSLLYSVGKVIQYYTRWRLNDGAWSSWIKFIDEEYYIEKLDPPLEIIIVPQDLPNQPQQYKPMNCCDKIEEMYKYFGIAKMKKKKFKVAKA
ncbi:hypothetical protein, partial [Microcoleus sp. herbarium14]|uniref:hypothetical protein n=1 Tax=Microcoleus sp. herbarium14 TaxID=3055439 RepID=UPI002FD3A8FD